MKNKPTVGGSVHFIIKDHYKAIQCVREGLKKAILACPGPSKASGIKEISGRPKCCTVSSSSLVGTIWAAETYIFSVQYEALADLISKGEPDTIIERLLTALKKGKVKPNTATGSTINLHPEVIANVRKMLKENA